MSGRYKLGTVEVDGAPAAALFVGDDAFALGELVAATLSSNDRKHLGWTRATSVLDVLEAWAQWEPVLGELAGAASSSASLPAPVHCLPPVLRPGKIVGAGANYLDHLVEMKAERPARPYFFLKPATSLIGAGEPLRAPGDVHWLDWEAELAAVVGMRARHVAPEDALGIVAGYTVANDVSNRDTLLAASAVLGPDWVEHKGGDGFTPLGPAITPARAVPDPQALAIRLVVNGVTKQESSTAQMIFGVAELLSTLSRRMTLEPGDVVLTGTPAGVGFAAQPRERLVPGDVVTVEIEGLGTLTTPVIQEEAA